MPEGLNLDDRLKILMETARDRETFYRGKALTRSEHAGDVGSAALGALFFAMGVIAGTPGLDLGIRGLLVTPVVVYVVVVLALAYEVISRPRRALEDWTAMRYETLQELVFRASMDPNGFLDALTRIGNDLARWGLLGEWTKYRRIVGRARRERRTGLPVIRFTDYAEALRFVLGEVSGPWEFVQ